MSLDFSIAKDAIMDRLLKKIDALRSDGKSADEILKEVESWASKERTAVASGWD